MERVVELILDNLEIPQCITISPNIVTSMDKWCCPFWTFAHSVGKECAVQKKAPVHRVARCRQMAYCVDHDAAPCTALKVQNCQLRQWIVVSSCSPTSYPLWNANNLQEVVPLEMQQRWTCGAPGSERRDFREGLQYAKRINCIEWMVKKKNGLHVLSDSRISRF